MGTGINLREQNLQDRSFRGQDLTHADFTGADLRGCNFTGATLVGATFERVQTGQSFRQLTFLRTAAVLGPLMLLLFSFLIAKLSERWWLNLPAQQFQLYLSGLMFLLFLARELWGNSLAQQFPLLTAALGIAVISTLLAVIASMTLGLAVVGVLSLGSSDSVLQGLFCLLLMVAFMVLLLRILQWLVQSIHAGPGTSFQKANLTHANFSHTILQNADFSMAVLTGICIERWLVQAHVQFNQIHCQYLYLDAQQQMRQPIEGDFQAGEVEKRLRQIQFSVK